MKKKSYTIKEVAELLGVSESTIRNWSSKGSLWCYRTLGGHRRFKSKTLIKFAKENNLDISEGD